MVDAEKLQGPCVFHFEARSMTYELAKQLKERGFPQDSQFKTIDRQHCPPASNFNTAQEMIDATVFLPSLSELIEACGTPFRLTSYTNGVWNASDKITSDGIMTHGDTPDEAVAKLWLALHPLTQ
jgi:hypothetical protein